MMFVGGLVNPRWHEEISSCFVEALCFFLVALHDLACVHLHHATNASMQKSLELVTQTEEDGSRMIPKWYKQRS